MEENISKTEIDSFARLQAIIKNASQETSEQEIIPYSYNTALSIRSLMALEKFELSLSECRASNTGFWHAKVGLYVNLMKDPVSYTILTTCRACRTLAFLKKMLQKTLWDTIFTDAGIHYSYFEFFAGLYMDESQSREISIRRFTLSKLLYPNMTAMEAVENFNFLEPLDLVSAFRRALFAKFDDLLDAPEPSQNATAETKPAEAVSEAQGSDMDECDKNADVKCSIKSFSRNANNLAFYFKTKCDILEMINFTRDQILPYDVTQFLIYLMNLESEEIMFDECEVDSDRAKLMHVSEIFRGIRCDHPANFDTFSDYKAAILNKYWQKINDAAGNDKKYFELFSSCYIAESQAEVSDRKYLLHKNFYPNMSNDEAEDKLINHVRVDIAAAIRRAVCETMPLELDEATSAQSSQSDEVTQPAAGNVPQVEDQAQCSTIRSTPDKMDEPKVTTEDGEKDHAKAARYDGGSKI